MISPADQAIIQIDITNMCPEHCSNCTRALDHHKKRFIMSLDDVEKALQSLAKFPYGAPKDWRRKLVGLIGGEPMVHPNFPDVVDLMIKYIPNRNRRGLWTSFHWDDATLTHKWNGREYNVKEQVQRLLGPTPQWNMKGPASRWGCGYINNNTHDYHLDQTRPEGDRIVVKHPSILVASREVFEGDDKTLWEQAEGCNYQKTWSATIIPQNGKVVGYYCEVAAHLCLTFNQPLARERRYIDEEGREVVLPVGSRDPRFDVGLDVTQLIDGRQWWDQPMTWETLPNGVRQPTKDNVYRKQILTACPLCSGCVPLKTSQVDHHEIDDCSPGNAELLLDVGSPRAYGKRGSLNILSEPRSCCNMANTNYNPLHYLQGRDTPEGKIKR